MINNEETFATGLITDQDNINATVDEITSSIDNKINEFQPRNRAERRALQKKLGKKGRAKRDAISDTAKKLDYIHLIQKLRELNEKKENEENEATED